MSILSTYTDNRKAKVQASVAALGRPETKPVFTSAERGKVCTFFCALGLPYQPMAIETLQAAYHSMATNGDNLLPLLQDAKCADEQIAATTGELLSRYDMVCGANASYVVPVVARLIPIEDRNVQYIRKNMGIEQERIDRLCLPYTEMPMIGILWPEGELTVIDGNHRFIKLHEAGVAHAKCYIFTYPFWENLLIDLPNDRALLDGKSGLIEREKEMKNG